MAVEDSDVLRRLPIHVEEVRWWWQKQAIFFFFYTFCSLLFWRCMVERDEQSEREKQQHREKEEGASLLCGRKRD
jgi:membrane protein implicated in regulation of membrane protease activity